MRIVGRRFVSRGKTVMISGNGLARLDFKISLGLVFVGSIIFRRKEKASKRCAKKGR